jgi:hypothetical protein
VDTGDVELGTTYLNPSLQGGCHQQYDILPPILTSMLEFEPCTATHDAHIITGMAEMSHDLFIQNLSKEQLTINEVTRASRIKEPDYSGGCYKADSAYSLRLKQYFLNATLNFFAYSRYTSGTRGP